MAKNSNTEEYIYLTIPIQYTSTYKKIMIVLSEYGEDMLKDCKATCKDRNSNIIDCFNMFNSALAAYQLGKVKLADTIIKYIDAKLIQIYGGSIPVEPGPIPPPADDKFWYIGQLNATASQFEQLTVEELLASAVGYKASVKQVDFHINNSCWYMMIRADMSVVSASYTAGGITSLFDKQEIESGFGDTARHDDVEIGGVTYHVYVNRNYYLIDSNASGVINIE